MKKLIFLAICFFLGGCTHRIHAQVPVALAPIAHQQFLDASGRPLAGGLVHTYAAGTTTPVATYLDFSGLYQNTNPIILDAGGFANIWLTSASYKICVSTASNVQQWCIWITWTALPHVISAISVTSLSANPAQSGFIRMAFTDKICWRENSNTNDECLVPNSTATPSWMSLIGTLNHPFAFQDIDNQFSDRQTFNAEAVVLGAFTASGTSRLGGSSSSTSTTIDSTGSVTSYKSVPSLKSFQYCS